MKTYSENSPIPDMIECPDCEAKELDGDLSVFDTGKKKKVRLWQKCMRCGSYWENIYQFKYSYSEKQLI